MRSLKKVILMLTLTLLLSTSLIPSKAQQTQQEDRLAVQSIEMADTFRQEGKIYVVVAVILLLLGGLVVYTITIDRKVRRLEKDLEIHD